MTTRRTSVRTAGLVAALAVTSTLLAAPSTAQAAEGVQSSYRVGCTVHPDDGSASSTDPAELTFDGERNDITVDPAGHRLTAGSLTVAPAAGGDDCGVSGRFGDVLTVGPGNSGLAAGDRVPVTVTVRLAGALEEQWDTDAHFQTEARYEVNTSIRSMDDCTSDLEGTICDTPLAFNARHVHQVFSGGPSGSDPDGYVQATATQSSELTTNDGIATETWVDESRPGHEDGTDLCAAWPCDPAAHRLHPGAQEPQVFGGPATLVVGSGYQVAGWADLFTSAWNNADVRASAAVSDFSIEITPAVEVELAYTSAGDVPPDEGPQDPPADETAPTVTATPAPDAVDGWHAGPVTVTLSAADAGSGVQSISYATTGAVLTGETVVPGATAEVGVAADGVTEVTYSAVDVAGNVSSPQTLTVRIDSVAPTIQGLADVTVAAPDGSGAVVAYSVTAQDALTPSPTVTCQPPSGSRFPVGATAVTCTATDAAGNPASGGFTVTVTPPPSVFDRLGEAIASLGGRKLGVKIALSYLLRAAEERFDRGQPRVGCIGLSTMDGFVTVLWFTGQVTTPEADTLQGLIREAQREKHC